jgi:hypothetical protein
VRQRICWGVALHACWNIDFILDVENFINIQFVGGCGCGSEKGTVSKQVKAHCMPGCMDLEQWLHWLHLEPLTHLCPYPRTTGVPPV